MAKQTVPVITDKDKMTFGKHKGQPMSLVPASWLLWLWKQNEQAYPILKYIEDNLEGLQAEVALKDKNASI